MSIKELLHQEIDRIPDSFAPDIMNYLKFLGYKSENEALTKQVGIISEPSFTKIWDNEEDSAYDTLW